MGDDKAGAKPVSQTESNSSSSGGPSGRLVQRAPRTARSLDPSGIYDARSMARRRLARRRRQISSLVMLAVAVAAGAAAIFRGRQPRVATWSPSRLIETDLDIAALAPLSAPSRSAQPEVVAVGRDGRMALLQASGQALPLRAGDFPLRAQPLVARGLILIGGEDGVLRAFDATSRRLRWQSAGDGAISGRAVLFQPPSTWAALPAPAPTPAAASTASPAPSATPAASPVAAPRSEANRPGEEAVAVGDDAGVVRAVRLSDGKLLWRARVGAPCGNGLSAARVRGGRVLIFVPVLSGVARRGGVLALDARDGKVAWSYPSDERLFSAMMVPPLVRSLDGQARLFCADDAGVVSALDAATGRSSAGKRASGQWKAFLTPLPAAAGAGAFGQRSKAPAASPSPTALGAGDGAGSAVPGAEGGGARGEGAPLVSPRCEMLWVADPRGPILVVAGNDGGVRAFAARSGRLLWVGDAGEAPVALVAAPRVGTSRAGASIVVVTPHAIERRSVSDGHRLARSEWGEEMGPAQAAASTPARLFVAARDVAAFDWASAPE